MKVMQLVGGLVGLFLLLAGQSLQAQTVNEAKELYNAAATAKAEGNIEQAIANIEKYIAMGEQVEDMEEGWKEEAQNVLCGLFYEQATDLLKAKDYEAALTAHQKTAEYAKSVNNTEVQARAEKRIPAIYHAMGTAAFQAKDYPKAIELLNKTLELDPEAVKTLYALGVAYQASQDEANMAASFKKAAELKDVDAASANNAAKSYGKYYYNKGIKAIQQKKFADAVESLTSAVALEHELVGDAYYRLATANNGLKAWDAAIEACQKALPYKPEGLSKATDGIYYELGTAYQNKGDKVNACAAYKKVTSAPFLDGAKYQIETALQCK